MSLRKSSNGRVKSFGFSTRPRCRNPGTIPNREFPISAAIARLMAGVLPVSCSEVMIDADRILDINMSLKRVERYWADQIRYIY